MTRIKWAPVLEEGARWVRSRSRPPTPRGLFYFLATEGLLPNAASYYRRLSAYTAAGRRDGSFPELSGPRMLVGRQTFDAPDQARDHIRNLYRSAIDDLWDHDLYAEVVEREDQERGEL